jgi:acetyl-CoA carboxylase carboxyl transferase subunit beta
VNWINNVVRPKIRSFLTTKREVPDNLWIKCPETGQMVFYKDLEANQFVVPGSNYHMRMGADVRLQHLFDGGHYDRVPVPPVAQDPLKFRDGRRYSERLKDAKANTDLEDAVLVADGKLDGQAIVAAAQDFRFMAGSLGMAAGEAVISGMTRAAEKKTPFILFAASGGARMQEGILSLMQMPRTTIAVQRLREAKLPYIVVLTDPTTGGVTASYAMLGDIHIAEPGALICFAGPRVIQQTIREQLPEGFQRAEYLLAHGMIDMVVHRHQLRETLSRLCHLLMNERPVRTVDKKKLNGKSHTTNGSGVESTLISSRNGSTPAIEPEIVGPEERFDPARIEHHERQHDDDEDVPATRSQRPKDRH